MAQRFTAGIDIGATEVYIAVPAGRVLRPVLRFLTFTEDLLATADWLSQCDIKTPAMESTNVYWIPLFQILEARGMEVCLVNACHVKNVPARLHLPWPECSIIHFDSSD